MADIDLDTGGIASGEAFGSPTLWATPGRLAQTNLEVAIGDTNPPGRLAQTNLEVAIGDTTPPGRLAQTNIEVAIVPDRVLFIGDVGGIPSEEAFGDETDSLTRLELFPGGPEIYRVDGPDTAEAFGVPQLIDPLFLARPASLFGEVTIILSPAGIPSGESFGEPRLGDEFVILAVEFGPSTEFGTPVLYTLASMARPVSLFGETDTAVVAHIQAYSFEGGEAFGIPRVLDGHTIFIPDGIPSEEAFGVPTLVAHYCHNAFVPPTERYVPVAYAGSNVDFLTGARMPDGRGLLVFIDYGTNPRGELRATILSSPEAWLANDVVLEVDTAVLLAANPATYDNLDACSCWEHNGDLFVALLWRNDKIGRVQWYIFDNPADPLAGITLHTTLQERRYMSVSYSGKGDPDNWVGHDEGTVAGIPYYLPDGSYVYTGGLYGSFSTGGSFGVPTTTHSTIHAGLWYNGTVIINTGYYMVGGAFVDYVSPTIQRDPRTGWYYWITLGGPLGGGHVWVSTGDLSSWAVADTFNWQAGDSGIYAFGFNEYQDEDGNPLWFRLTGFLLEMVDFADSTTWVQQTDPFLTPFAVDSTKIVVIGDPWLPCASAEDLAYYLFEHNSVQGTPVVVSLGGWIVGLTQSGELTDSGWQ